MALLLYNGKGGAYVFNTVHNTQAKTPIANFIAMLNPEKKFNGEDTEGVNKIRVYIKLSLVA